MPLLRRARSDRASELSMAVVEFQDYFGVGNESINLSKDEDKIFIRYKGSSEGKSILFGKNKSEKGVSLADVAKECNKYCLKDCPTEAISLGDGSKVASVTYDLQNYLDFYLRSMGKVNFEELGFY